MLRFSALFFLLLPLKALTQPSYELGLTGGFSDVLSLKNTHENTYLYSHKRPVSHYKAYGFNGTLKILLDIHKWQFGFGAETGGLSGTVARDIGFKRDIEENFQYHLRIDKDVELEDQKIAAPYITPHIFVHMKFNFSDHVYMYAGPIGGRMFSKNELSWNGQSAGWVAGGNLGIAVRLNDRIILDLSEGYRISWVRGAELIHTNRKQWHNDIVLGPEPQAGVVVGDPNVAFAINRYNLSYATSSVGIRVRL